MPGWLKVILVLFGILIVVFALGIGGFVYWLDTNKGELEEIALNR